MAMKTIMTFGSAQLTQFNVKPMKVMLVSQLCDVALRELAMKTEGIGLKFCTTYDYDAKVEEFEDKYDMCQYTYEELMLLRRTNDQRMVIRASDIRITSWYIHGLETITICDTDYN